MSEVYGFLRFQIPGTAFLLYTILFLLPFFNEGAASFFVGNTEVLVGSVALLFVVSMAVGYAIHQFVVNKLRRSPRPVHALIARETEAALPRLTFASDQERLKFTDSLLAFCAGTSDKTVQGMLETKDIPSKLDARWSHLYARKALGKYSLICAVVAVAFVLSIAALPRLVPALPLLPVFAKAFDFDPYRWVVMIAELVIAILVATRMNSYAGKLVSEISALEYSMVVEKLPILRAHLGKLAIQPGFETDIRGILGES